MTWTFYLNVTNDTDRDLELVESQLHWGYWNTDGEEDKKPQAIKAGQTIQAVGAKSAFGPNGYEFSCSWKDKNNETQAPYGVISLYVNVPYNDPNEASCRANGYFEVADWKDIAHDGHNFVRNIRIFNKLDISKQKELNNDLNTNWSKIKALVEIEDVRDIDLNQYIPSGVHFEKMSLFRTPAFNISKKLWDGVNDLEFDSLYLKQREVQQYFSIEVTCLRADATKIETVTKKGKITVKDEYGISTASKVVEEKVSTIETAFKFTEKVSVSDEKVVKASVAQELQAELKAKFNILNAVTKEQQQTEKKSKERVFEAPSDKDMDVVPWIFSKMILLYRTDNNHVTTLIGASEWDYAVLHRTHLYDVMNNARKPIMTGGEY
ncbi:hypothetical protein [Lysinibacillus cavernae]|uniref:hypothetical protein n=1 Tax=Lysinibacillus cavernae TaxID=2666135 RepID=UPI0012D857BB|nr:hypothetical protein [Lysinibacillus cavernae]